MARIAIEPVTAELGRKAGESLGRTGLSGHRCAIDSVVAATALTMPRPVIIVTSDSDDMNQLVDEPGRPEKDKIIVVHGRVGAIAGTGPCRRSGSAE